MRKLAGILLLSMMLWQIIGFVGYFEYSHYIVKKHIKKQLKEGVPSSELVHFTFTEKELSRLTWIKKHEFELNGSLFDIVRKTRSKLGYQLECISDKQETVLFAGLGKKIAGNLSDQDTSPGVVTWLKMLQSPSVPLSFPLVVLSSSEYLRVKHSYHYLFSVISDFVDTPLQPPCA